MCFSSKWPKQRKGTKRERKREKRPQKREKGTKRERKREKRVTDGDVTDPKRGSKRDLFRPFVGPPSQTLQNDPKNDENDVILCQVPNPKYPKVLKTLKTLKTCFVLF